MTIDKGIYIKNIFYMLSYAFQQLRQNNYEDISGEDFDDMYDLFSEILIRGVSFQLKQGLHREYVAQHDSLSTLKGKMNMNGTIHNMMQRKQKIDCEFDELTENNVFNQILKATILLLLKHPNVKSSKGSSRKSSLRKLILFFSNVDVIDLSIVNWSSLRFDRNSKTYQMLLYICYFIMNDLLMTTESGSYKMNSFKDDQMNLLFQRFVLEYYKKHFPEVKAHATQINWNLDLRETTTDDLPIMQTDIMLTFKERELIIDTKYYSKTMQVYKEKHTLHSSNLYQIQSYVLNKDIKHTGSVDGMLLYAKTEESINPDGQMKFRDGNVIYFRTLDLGKTFDSIKEELNSFILHYQ